jgi:hypothetical protein
MLGTIIQPQSALYAQHLNPLCWFSCSHWLDMPNPSEYGVDSRDHSSETLRSNGCCEHAGKAK